MRFPGYLLMFRRNSLMAKCHSFFYSGMALVKLGEIYYTTVKKTNNSNICIIFGAHGFRCVSCMFQPVHQGLAVHLG